MSELEAAYVAATGRQLPIHAAGLARWFDQMQTGELLPPRSVQAVQAGLIGHALSDPKADPPHYHYYTWVVEHLRSQGVVIHELSAQLIGMAFVSTGVLATDLPQPLTLNPWQVAAMGAWPLATKRAVIIENNGVFIWLHQLHPDWPLIAQGGNDFQPAYLNLLTALVTRGLSVTYLGDLDATGIRMADTLRQALPTSREFLALQSPTRVMGWLSAYGKDDPRRTRRQAVQDPELRMEMNSIAFQGQFVEQEQLLDDYERLIRAWLGEN
ncbi:DUF2399 domain-containing protein [Lacticaseibacillus absianus]|uniref:DUF2399 domain-containing protein n=1 Tax=Lacticaseibacillus absianus TaxID=2729623 RepID=UPI0015C80DE7|nr:DUF2399 domain-containing protein [Lacticaseibacillus absianus]